GAPASRDTILMVDALRALGVRIEIQGERITVDGGGGLRGGGTVDCGLAGTVMRFVPPLAALADGPVRFDGDPRARERPMGPVLARCGHSVATSTEMRCRSCCTAPGGCPAVRCASMRRGGRSSSPDCC